MKVNLITKAFTALITMISCIILITSLGCSDNSTSPTTISQAPQGELIQGEPIEPTQEEQLPIATTQEETNPDPLTGLSDGPQVRTIESPEGTGSLGDSNTTTQATRQVMVTASQPEVIRKIVLEEPDIIPMDGKYVSVSFDKLASFEYTMPEDLTEPVANEEGQVYKEQIPSSIKELNDTNISLKGFMLPLKVEKGSVTEMLIMRDQSMCCYGTVPKINEWVSVRMEDEGVKPVMDEPVTIYGTLKVGEVLENGYLVGIYEMDGQSMSFESADN